MIRVIFRKSDKSKGIEYWNPERTNILIKVKDGVVKWVKFGFNAPCRKVYEDKNLEAELVLFFKSSDSRDAVIVGYANNELILLLKSNKARGVKYYFGYNPVQRKFREITDLKGLQLINEDSAVTFPELKATRRILLGQ